MKIGISKELENRSLKGTLKSKFKSHFKIEIEKGILKSKIKRNFKIGGTWQIWEMLGELSIWSILTGEPGGDAPGGTNRGERHCPAIKKLSKDPLKLRLVRERNPEAKINQKHRNLIEITIWIFTFQAYGMIKGISFWQKQLKAF